MSENKKYFHPDLLKQEISQISAGDIIAVKFGQKLKEFFVYDVTSSLEDPVLFLCIRVRKKEEALKENGLPGYFYNDRIISYGVPHAITPEKVSHIVIHAVKRAEQIAAFQRKYLRVRRISPDKIITYSTTTIIRPSATEKPAVQKQVVVKEKPAAKTKPAVRTKQPTPEYKKIPKSSGVPKAEEYSVTDRIVTGVGGVCPVCNSRVNKKPYNVPVFDEKNNFHSYYQAELYYCPGCHRYFITDKAFHNLVSRINAASPRYHLSPGNMSRRYDSISRAYLYAPVATEFPLFRGMQPRRFAGEDRSGGRELSALNESSFLADMGYSTSLPMSTRRRILDDAIRKFSRRKVADHIRFLIKMRESQKNGAARYATAISVWQEDLNYIAGLR